MKYQMRTSNPLLARLPGRLALCLSGLFLASALAQAGPHGPDDVLVTDFEFETWPEGWSTEGNAFGAGPATGRVGRQRPVVGWEGARFANSYLDDDSKGVLRSAEFTIERDHLVGMLAGNFSELRVLVGDEVVGTLKIGLRELGMRWQSLDVSAHRGKRARFELEDMTKGDWGFVAADSIFLSDSPVVNVENSRTMPVTERFLNLPVRDSDAAPARFEIRSGEEVIHRFDTAYAYDGKTDFWGVVDLEAYQGKQITIQTPEVSAPAHRVGEYALKHPQFAAVPIGEERLYDEALRPQLGFSQIRGWANDPNGMVYHDGVWHFFWQYNPVGPKWGNMYWGHATSKDLVHWEEHPPALRPYVDAGGMCWSGGGFVDFNNSSGFGSADNPPLMVAFTNQGGANQGESLAYSLDGGENFTPYSKNPILPPPGRDPKVFWYAPSKHWVLVVYEPDRELGHVARIYNSTNLVDWTKTDAVPDIYECPDLFELPVPGRPGESKWILQGGDGKYYIGSFDGKKYTPDHKERHLRHAGPFFAAQNFTDAPDKRAIQVGWMRGYEMKSSATTMFTLPKELELKETPEGLRMTAMPVRELEALRGDALAVDVDALNAATAGIEIPLGGELWDIELAFEVEPGADWTVEFDGRRIHGDKAGAVQRVPAYTEEGRVTLRLMIDRPSYEAYVNGGLAHVISGRKPGPVSKLTIASTGTRPVLKSAKIYPMRSIWTGNPLYRKEAKPAVSSAAENN